MKFNHFSELFTAADRSPAHLSGYMSRESQLQCQWLSTSKPVWLRTWALLVLKRLGVLEERQQVLLPWKLLPYSSCNNNNLRISFFCLADNLRMKIQDSPDREDRSHARSGPQLATFFLAQPLIPTTRDPTRRWRTTYQCPAQRGLPSYL